MKSNASVLRQLFLYALSAAVSINAVQAEMLSPKNSYLKYKSALSSASKIEDLCSFYCKQVNDEIKQTPPEMKPMLFSLMKETSPQLVTITSEDVSGDSAKLALVSSATEANKSPNVSETTTGTVTFLKEDGEWKIKKETWSSKIESK
jgi:hypothetical protein